LWQLFQINCVWGIVKWKIAVKNTNTKTL